MHPSWHGMAWHAISQGSQPPRGTVAPLVCPLGCASSSNEVATNIRFSFFCPEIRAEGRFQVIMGRCRLHQNGSNLVGKG